MPKLITDFFTVAQEGPTFDGRVMQERWLKDAAETYNAKKYLAKIWPEHMRWRPLGEVQELRVSKNAEGLTILENRISPSDDLIYYVRNNMMTQPSIEIIEDFAGSGKFYQFGLGAVDMPASLGVDKIPVLFNQQHLELYTARTALDAQVPVGSVHIFQCPTTWADLEFKKPQKIFDFGALFRSKPTQPSQEDIDMTKDEFKEVLGGFKAELKAELVQELSAKPALTPEKVPEPKADSGAKPTTDTFNIEQFNTLAKQVDDLTKQVQTFNEYMSQDNTPPRKEQGSGNSDDLWNW